MSNNIFLALSGISTGAVNNPPNVSLTGTLTRLRETRSFVSPYNVAAIVVTDDGTGTNTLSLSGTDSSLFEISGTDLRVKSGTTLSYSGNPVLDVTVSVDDITVGVTPDSSTPLSINVIPTVVYIDGATTYSGGSVAFTNYQTGDLLVAQVFRGADTTAITVPAGWNVIGTPTAAQNIYSLQAYRYATTDGADTLGTWTNASSIRYHAIRYAHPTTPIAAYTNPTAQASSATITHPAVTIANSGNNIILEASYCRLNTEGVAPGLRGDATTLSVRTTAGSSHARYARSTSLNVATWASQAVGVLTGANSGGSHVMVVEIRGENE